MKTRGIIRLAAVAAVAFMTGSLWAANPIAIWDGENTNLGNFSLTAQNGNNIENNVITIAQGATGGVVYTGAASSLNNSTFIIRCSGLDLANASNQYLLTVHQNMLGGGNGDASYNKVGASLAANNAAVRGIWENGFYGTDGDSLQVADPFSQGTEIVVNVQTSGGIFVYEILTDAQTGARTLVKRYGHTGLKASKTNYKGFSLGGIYEKSSSTLASATGWTITQMAVFGSTLSESEILDYAFPSDIELEEIAATASGGTIDASCSDKNLLVTGEAGGYATVSDAVSAYALTTAGEPVTLKFSDGAALSLDSVDASEAAITIDVSGVDAAALARNAVKGAPYRVWPVKASSITGSVAIDAATVGALPAGYACSVIETPYGQALEFTSTYQFGSLNINFGAGVSSDPAYSELMHGAFPVVGSSWNDVAAQNAADVAVSKYVQQDGTLSVEGSSTITLTQVKNSWTTQDSSTARILYEYLDDGSNPQAVISNIPFAKYRVIAYAATDTNNTTFSAKTIESVSYSTASAGSTATPTLAGATGAWGSSSNRSELVEGVNYLVSDVISGTETVTIQNNKTTGRACLPAVQIVEVGVEDLAIAVSGTGLQDLTEVDLSQVAVSFVEGTTCTVVVAEEDVALLGEVPEGVRVVTGTVTAANSGTVTASGDLVVHAGDVTLASASTVTSARVEGGSLDVGVLRPTIESVAEGATLKVSAVVSMSERLAGYESVTSIPMTGDLAGSVVYNGVQLDEFELDDGVLTLAGEAIPGEPTLTGAAWWWDYEFDGNGDNIGSEGTALSWDGDRAFKNNEYTAADNDGNRMLHLPSRPWRNVSAYPAEYTVVGYCKAGATANSVLVAFGSSTWGSRNTISLCTGADPAAGQMRLVYGAGQSSSTDLVPGGFTLDNITTSNHLYAFVSQVVDGNTQISVYADGSLLTTYTHEGTLTLGTGFQIASGHGGLPKGLVRPADDDTATMDFLRVADEALSPAAIRALAAAYPYVSPNGKATREVEDGAVWVSDEPAWQQHTLNDDGSSSVAWQTEPNHGTMVEVSAVADTTIVMNLAEAVSYETLTLGGPGAITFAAEEGAVAPSVTSFTTIGTDVTMPLGAFAFGAVTLADGVTLTVEVDQVIEEQLMSLGIHGSYVVPVTGTVTFGEGASVVMVGDYVDQVRQMGYTVSLEPNAANAYIFTFARNDAPITIRTTYDDPTPRYAMGDMPLAEVPDAIPAGFASTVTIANKNAAPLELSLALLGGTVSVSEGTVVLAGDVTTESGVTVDEGATLVLAGVCSAPVEVAEGAILEIAEGAEVSSTVANGGELIIGTAATFAGLLTGEGVVSGDGTILVTSNDVYQGMNRAALADGEAWTGTVCLRGFSVASWVQDVYPWADYVTDGIVQNYPYSVGSLGNANSTIELDGLSSGSYLTIGRTEIVSTLKITGTNAISGGFSVGEEGNSYMYGGRTVVSGPVVGDGTLSLSGAGDQWFLSGALDGFAGTLFVAANKSVVIGSTDPDLCQSATVVVADGATLDNGFTVDSALSLASGSVLDASEGAVTVTGVVTFGENVTVNLASAPDAEGVQVLAAANSGIEAGSEISATVKVDGATLENVLLVAGEDGLYAVAVSRVVIPEGIEGAAAEALIAAAEAAGVKEITAVVGNLEFLDLFDNVAISIDEGVATIGDIVFQVEDVGPVTVGGVKSVYVVVRAEDVAAAASVTVLDAYGAALEGLEQVEGATLDREEEEGVYCFVAPLPEAEGPVLYKARVSK